MHRAGRRRHANFVDGTVQFATPENKGEAALADKAQEYDRALRQSQYAASARRRSVGGGSVLGASSGMGSVAGPSSASATYGGYSIAQTAVLGDSQGSELTETAGQTAAQSRSIPVEDLGTDEGVVSGLGDSYVDGAKRSKTTGEVEEEEDELQDDGVLGLLAQIYGRKEGAAGVLQ